MQRSLTDTIPTSDLKRFAGTAAGVHTITKYKLSLFDPNAWDGDVRGAWRDAGSIKLNVHGDIFGRGGFRKVYKATEESTGKEYVVKRYHQNVKEHIVDVMRKQIEEHARLDIQKTAGIASYFASKFGTDSGHKLEYLPVYISQDHEPVFIEQFVDSKKGSFRKYINNTGLLESGNPPKEQEVCEAFVHYTLHKSHGELMVCDVQGWLPLLCDPEIATWEIDGNDLGTAGNHNKNAINEFLGSHKCSLICKNLGLSTVKGGNYVPTHKDIIVAETKMPSEADPYCEKEQSTSNTSVASMDRSFEDETTALDDEAKPGNSMSMSQEIVSKVKIQREDGVATPSSPSSTSKGFHLSHNYVIMKQIGTGGFGTVHMCTDKITGKDFAMKKVRHNTESSSSLQEQVKALRNEMNILKKLTHTNVVAYYDSIVEEGFMCICMEFVNGGSMKEYILEVGLLTNEHATICVHQVLLGLSYLHKENIIHRDLKAANILRTNEGIIKIADFGISKMFDTFKSTKEATGMIGSPFWMSPEIAKNEKYSKQVDVWGVGVTAFELLSGNPPFGDCQVPWTAIYQIIQGNTKEKCERTFPPAVSDLLRSFVMNCVELNPRDRPSVDELLQLEMFSNIPRLIVV